MHSSTDAVRKRRSREWDPRTMNAEVFETPDPEVTFQPYAAVHAAGAHAQVSPEESHGFDKANMELDEGAVLPTQAFEVFMGKVYKPTSRVPERTELEASGGKHDVAMTRPTKSVATGEFESPLQRFTRLQMEIKDLESDLGLLAANAETKRSDATAVVVVDAAQDAEYSDIMQGLATLQLNLSAMEETARFQPFLQPAAMQADAVASMQRDLTAKFFQQIDVLKRTPTAAATSTGSSTAPIVYEIYSNGELNAVDRDAKTRLLTLESRLAMLENVIGATNPKALHVDGLRASASASADLSSLIDELDKRVGLLSEKNLDAIKTRTTALVHEFTLLHKLKESPNVQAALATQADREKIQQIYDQLQSVQDVAASVPALVDRLVTLRSVHDESLDLSTRVVKMEQSQGMLQDLLESDVSILNNIEKSLQDNVQIFQANLQTLDERMNLLLSGASR